MIKNKLGIKFHSKPIYEQKYLKSKIIQFYGVIKTNYLGNGTSKENMHYNCIAWITIDSVININKKNYRQVYLEECKYRVKKIQMSRFINSELDSDSDSKAESKSYTELNAPKNHLRGRKVLVWRKKHKTHIREWIKTAFLCA